MANDMIQTVLASVLEDLEALKKSATSQTEALDTMGERLMKIEESLQGVKQQVEKPLNTIVLEIVITEMIEKLRQTVAMQPKEVVHERRILLFPEYNANEYYKTVVARLSLAVIAIIFTTYFFLLCREMISDWFTVHSQQTELNEYRNAWQQLHNADHTKKKKSQ